MLRRALLLLPLSLLAGCGPIAGAIIIAVDSGGGGSSGGGGGAPPPPGQPGPGPTQPPPDDPLASILLAAATQEDVPLNVQVPTTTPDGDPLSYTLQSAPSAGSISGQPPNFVYTPFPNWHGSDRVTYRISAGGQSAQAVVDITVQSVNDPPAAQSMAYALPENTALPVTLQGSDVDGDPLSFEVLTPPTNGSLSGSGANRTYTPNPNYTGPDAFTFRAVDAQGGFSLGATIQLDVRRQLVLTSVSPDRGDLGGGTRLTITGDRFSPATVVAVGGQTATGISVIDSNTIECDTVAGPLGYARVELSEPTAYAAGDDTAYFYEGWEGPFSNIIQLESGTTEQYVPSLVATPSGALGCVWVDERTGIPQLRFATSSDQGQTWLPSVLLEPDDMGPFPQPYLTVSPTGVLACVWRVNIVELRFARSLDGGASWSAPVRVDTVAAGKEDPTLLVEASGAITCAWEDPQGQGTILFSRSLDGGATWSPEAAIDDSAANPDQSHPFLARTSAGMACVYAERLRSGSTVTAAQVVLALSNDGGASWTLTRVDDDPNVTPTAKSFTGLVETSPGTLVCTWQSARDGNSIRCARSTDGGASWSPSVVLASNGSFAYPTLAWDSAGTLVCTWRRATSFRNDDVYGSRSLDGGASWSAPSRVDDDPNEYDVSSPIVVAFPSGPFVCAWSDARNGHQDIRCANSTDATSWSASTRVDDDPTDTRRQNQSRVAFEADGSIVVAWTDTRGAESEIYLARSADGGASWTQRGPVGADDEPEWTDSRPSLLVDASGAWVLAWVRTSGTYRSRRAIVSRRSTDQGASWSDEVVLNPGTLDAGNSGRDQPILVQEPAGALVCMWEVEGGSGTVRFTTSTDDGASWAAPVDITEAQRVLDFSFSAGAANWFCTWIENVPSGDPLLWVATSVDHGATWTAEARSPGSGSEAAFRVAHARHPSALVVVWLDDDDGTYWIAGSSVGTSWSNAALLESGSGGYDVGVAAEPSGFLTAAWDRSDSATQSSLHFSRGPNGLPITWGPVQTGYVYPPPPVSGTNTTRFEDIATGPNGQIVITGYDPEPPRDPVFVRGWFRP